jgi:Peptidase family C25
MLGTGSVSRASRPRIASRMPATQGAAEVSQRTSYRSSTDKRPAFLLPAIAGQSKAVTLIMVGAEEQGSLAAAAPIAARIQRRGKIPILLATAPESRAIQSTLITQLDSALGSCVVMGQGFDALPEQIRGRCPIHVLPTASDCARAGLLAAMSFWQSTDAVVVGSVDDGEAAILGSALASHLDVPFIPVSGREDLRMISDGLEALGVKRVLFAASGSHFGALPADFSRWSTEVLDVDAIQKRLIEAIGKENIRNIVLFRVPDEHAGGTAVSWLAPYLSVMRNAAVVSCVSSDPLDAEAKVSRLIEAYSLTPRTATILADNESVEMIKATYGTEPNAYEVLLEPCSRPAQGRAADLGVGRIPCRQVWAASTLIARGIAGDYVLDRAAPKVLMIANPSEEYGALPLCETVSRATAKEFKNFGIHIDEFYGVPCDKPAIRALARDSQLIVYEGHITQFSLFEDPSSYPNEDNDSREEWRDDRADDFDETVEHIPGSSDIDSRMNFYEIVTGADRAQAPSSMAATDPDGQAQETRSQEGQVSPPMTPSQLEGAPLMIIQSCHSLDDSAMRILTGGATGILGSATNIHSSSGSALVKAFCDGLLSGRRTTGEALRDAQNYLLGVSILKTARGHKEQAKVLRVAYGFHLWGDPESRVFRGLTPLPNLKPVSAEFIGPDEIRIIVPRRRLLTSRTSKYFLRMFPGSEVAGIVKRLKDKDVRRIAPIYFFRLALPKNFSPVRYTGLKELNDTTVRAVFLVDSLKRFLYVLYFPEKEERGQDFTLRFVE